MVKKKEKKPRAKLLIPRRANTGPCRYNKGGFNMIIQTKKQPVLSDSPRRCRCFSSHREILIRPRFAPAYFWMNEFGGGALTLFSPILLRGTGSEKRYIGRAARWPVPMADHARWAENRQAPG